jgi:DNA mismatch endonuclease (patch repair protein)
MPPHGHFVEEPPRAATMKASLVMRPSPSSDSASSRMKRVRRRDTSAELAMRSALHRAGLRFRVDQRVERELPYRGDIVFRRHRVVVFVDGCFWHGCPVHGTAAKSNAEWWRVKIRRNRERDAAATVALRGAGWMVLRFWEHDSVEECAAATSATIRTRPHLKGR